MGIDYKTVSKIFKQLRAEIAGFIDVDFQELHGEIECDESYFGGHRKGTRGRGSAGKTIVFGLLERKGKVFTTVVENVEAQTLLNEIIAHTEKGSVFFTDKFRSYKSLKFYGKHHKIDHSREYAKKRIHINGLEGFWSFAKERFQKYHGVGKENFPLYLKEMEFRYNHRKENLYQLLCKIHFGPEIP
ncbi:MAG: IS1595 family transposase [Bacteroidetes bacterium]|nr:IS1595 family transposase [Bacteroidota bacterium]